MRKSKQDWKVSYRALTLTCAAWMGLAGCAGEMEQEQFPGTAAQRVMADPCNAQQCEAGYRWSDERVAV